MSESGHDLHSLFPGREETIHALKLNDELFKALADRHHLLSHQIHRIETDIEPTSDRRLEEFKKERLAVLDEIAAMIARRETA